MSQSIYLIKAKKGDMEIEAQAPTSSEALELLNKAIELLEKLSIEKHELVSSKTIEEKTSIDAFEKTSTGRIKYLIATGFFNTERSLSDTYEELSRLGYPYDVKSIDKSLRQLTRKGLLRRLGTRRNYRYIAVK
ncbi:MAG: hypothetical protein QXP60_07730 [Nitrososphaerota archaeon]